MNISCGVDIIEIDRIKSSIEDLKEKFLSRVFTENEEIYPATSYVYEFDTVTEGDFIEPDNIEYEILENN